MYYVNKTTFFVAAVLFQPYRSCLWANPTPGCTPQPPRAAICLAILTSKIIRFLNLFFFFFFGLFWYANCYQFSWVASRHWRIRRRMIFLLAGRVIVNAFSRPPSWLFIAFVAWTFEIFKYIYLHKVMFDSRYVLKWFIVCFFLMHITSVSSFIGWIFLT